MNKLSSISNETLHTDTLQAASNEKSATLKLLEYLAEVDRRRLYATRAYSSLWEYTHKALGYSEAQASDRVNAMRLMVQVPEVKRELASGQLTLTSTAKLGSHARREKLKPNQTAALIHQICGKSSREVERVLISKSQTPQQTDRARTITFDLTRITIEVDQSFLDFVQKVKELHGNPSLSFQETFALGMQAYIAKKKPLPQHQTKTVARAPEVGKRASFDSRYITVQARHEIRTRSGSQCEFIDPKTNRRCESKMGLQWDHVHPHAKGGPNTADNLRHLCRAHNTLLAIREYGMQKMQPYLEQSWNSTPEYREWNTKN